MVTSQPERLRRWNTSGRAVLCALAELLGILALEIDRQPQGGPAAKAHQQVHGMEAGEGGLKCGGKAVQQPQQLGRGVRAGGQPPRLPQFGGIEGNQHIGQVGEQIPFQLDLSHRSSTFFRTFSPVVRARCL